jgi:hypothetical protein
MVGPLKDLYARDSKQKPLTIIPRASQMKLHITFGLEIVIVRCGREKDNIYLGKLNSLVDYFV